MLLACVVGSLSSLREGGTDDGGSVSGIAS